MGNRRKQGGLMFLWKSLENKIRKAGGYVNAHAHFDRAYTLSPKDLEDVVYNQLEEKWRLVDSFKRRADINRYLGNFIHALEDQHDYGVTACLSFVDVDPVCGDKAIIGGNLAKERANKLGIELVLACQTLKGVLIPSCRHIIEAQLDIGSVDIIGSLPGADHGDPKHYDVIFELARRYNKRVHVHVDQLNTAAERETEMLARKTIEHGWEDKVTAVHSISLACHPKHYRQEVYKMAKDAGLSFISCPTAWIDHRRTEELTPNHNAITPVDELLEHDLTVALGTDNINDIYKPYSDGNMGTELRFLMEALHIYDQDTLVKIVTENGRKVIKPL